MTIFFSAWQHAPANSVHHWQRQGVENAYNRSCSQSDSVRYSVLENVEGEEWQRSSSITSMQTFIFPTDKVLKVPSVSLALPIAHRGESMSWRRCFIFTVIPVTLSLMPLTVYVVDDNNINSPYYRITYCLFLLEMCSQPRWISQRDWYDAVLACYRSQYSGWRTFSNFINLWRWCRYDYEFKILIPKVILHIVLMLQYAPFNGIVHPKMKFTPPHVIPNDLFFLCNTK